MAHVLDDSFDGSLGDRLGDTAVTSPPANLVPLAMGAMVILAAIGFYLGLNSGDHTTRLPGDTRNSGEISGADFSRAKVAVALKPEDLAPPPPPEAPKVEAAPVVEAAAAPVAEAAPAAVIEITPNAAPVPVAGPPPNLEGLF